MNTLKLHTPDVQTTPTDAAEPAPRLTLSMDEVAQRLGVGVRTIWLAVNRGELPSVRLGRRVLIPVAALDEWITRKSKARK